MKKLSILLITHIVTLLCGFIIGIYMLPILTAPASPNAEMLVEHSQEALFTGEIKEDLRGHDFLHWGKGTIHVNKEKIVHKGSLAPGPDYKLYLVSSFVEHEDEFLPIKEDAQLIGDVKSFDGFILDIPDGVNIEGYNTVVIWCEAFGEFITSARLH